MRGLGLRTDGACQQFDGSGLSRKNYVSPAFFVRFLRKMMTLPVWDAYFASLPVPGVKGTLETRFPDAEQEFKDRIHMKTGSMNGVRCFSGYILSADGDPKHTIVFSLLVNNSDPGGGQPPAGRTVHQHLGDGPALPRRGGEGTLQGRAGRERRPGGLPPLPAEIPLRAALHQRPPGYARHRRADPGVLRGARGRFRAQAPRAQGPFRGRDERLSQQGRHPQDDDLPGI